MTEICVLSPDILLEEARDGKSMVPHQTDRRVALCSKKSSNACEAHGMEEGFKSTLSSAFSFVASSSVLVGVEVATHAAVVAVALL